MCYIDGQENKYSVLNECSWMLKYNIFVTRKIASEIYNQILNCHKIDLGGRKRVFCASRKTSA
jgi:hypothetical protein